MQIKESYFTANFASPNLCEALYEAEVANNKIKYFWYQRKDGVEMVCTGFDPDKYYAGALKLISDVNQARVIPAFSIRDLESLLSMSYCVCKDAFGHYEIMIAEEYGVPSVKNARLADLFAMAVLECIKKRILISA